ncbi:hypothetical protein HWI79_2707 [Cryptosporidium felis]|nr:hypothetical protein HWI79_2707 [Cryptosporidium felis]
MRFVFALVLFLVQVSYVKIGHGFNVENSMQLTKNHERSDVSNVDSLRLEESPGKLLSIPTDGNSTNTDLLGALAAALPLKVSSGEEAEKQKHQREATELSYFEPRVLYTTIPVIAICMVGIALLAEFFGDGFESGRRRLSAIPESVKRRGRASI